MSQNHLNDLVDHYYWNYIINIISLTLRPGLLHHGRGALRRLAGLGPQRDLRAVAERGTQRTQRGSTRMGTRGTGGRWLGKSGIWVWYTNGIMEY